MTDKRAIDIIRENAIWDSVVQSLPCLERNIVDALVQAVAEEREACAKIADESAGPFPGVGRLLPCVEVASKIRARKDA